MVSRPKPKPPVEHCIFCQGASGADLTGEDLWPLWLSKEYPLPDINWWTATAATNKGERHPHRTKKLKKKLHIVCKTCNNEWMSRLETRLIPRLRPLMKDSNAPYELSEDATTDLVAWFTKMAMVWEFSIDTKPKFFNDHQRAAFSASLRPPDDVHMAIWMGRRHTTEAMTHASIRNWVWFDSLNETAPEFRSVDLYLQTSTFSIDQLVFQVLAKRGRKANPIALHRHDISDWAPGMYPLWPTPTITQQWPTRAYLKTAHLRVLARRFEDQGSAAT